jgi:hypothetical protein
MSKGYERWHYYVAEQEPGLNAPSVTAPLEHRAQPRPRVNSGTWIA